MNALQRICQLKGAKNRQKIQALISILKNHPDWINNVDNDGRTPLSHFLEHCDTLPSGLESEIKIVIDLFLKKTDLKITDNENRNIMWYIRLARTCYIVNNSQKVLLRYYIQDCLAHSIDLFQITPQGNRICADLNDQIDANIIIHRMQKIESNLDIISDQMENIVKQMSVLSEKIDTWDTFLD